MALFQEVRISDYQIIHDRNVSKLQSKVSSYCNKGYEPIGGIYAVINPNKGSGVEEYSQAIMKKEYHYIEK